MRRFIVLAVASFATALAATVAAAIARVAA